MLSTPRPAWLDAALWVAAGAVLVVSVALPWAAVRGYFGVVASVPGGAEAAGRATLALAGAAAAVGGALAARGGSGGGTLRRPLALVELALAAGVTASLAVATLDARAAGELARATGGLYRTGPGTGLWLGWAGDVVLGWSALAAAGTPAPTRRPVDPDATPPAGLSFTPGAPRPRGRPGVR